MGEALPEKLREECDQAAAGREARRAGLRWPA